jgi:hypothetical protein
VPLVSGVRRTTSAPMLPHGGSRLNASKPEANPKTRCPPKEQLLHRSYSLLPSYRKVGFLRLATRKVVQHNNNLSNRHSRNRVPRTPRRRKVKHMITRFMFIPSDHHDAGSHLPNAGCRTLTGTQKTPLRPSPNERTCMGWHERHASLRRGSRGTLRPEALNLEA